MDQITNPSSTFKIYAIFGILLTFQRYLALLHATPGFHYNPVEGSIGLPPRFIFD
jgi:hypothetical protein